MKLRSAIRRVVWPDANLTEFARDVARAFGSLVGLSLVSVTAQYAEPMYFAFAQQPVAVLALRVRESADPEAVVSFGCAVNFVYEPATGRVKVNDVQGMATGATEYVFDFLVVVS